MKGLLLIKEHARRKVFIGYAFSVQADFDILSAIILPILQLNAVITRSQVNPGAFVAAAIPVDVKEFLPVQEEDAAVVGGR